MDEENPQTNMGLSSQTESEALPSAPQPGAHGMGRGPKKTEADYRKEEYARAKLTLDKAMDLLKLYEEMGIAPCDVPRVHSAVRSAFGYGP